MLIRQGLGAFFVRDDWQFNGKDGSFAEPAGHLDVPAMILDYSVRNGKSESGSTVFLGGEERIEDLDQALFGNAAAGVGYPDEGELLIRDDADRNGQGAGAVHRL